VETGIADPPVFWGRALPFGGNGGSPTFRGKTGSKGTPLWEENLFPVAPRVGGPLGSGGATFGVSGQVLGGGPPHKEFPHGRGGVGGAPPSLGWVGQPPKKGGGIAHPPGGGEKKTPGTLWGGEFKTRRGAAPGGGNTGRGKRGGPLKKSGTPRAF